MCLKSSLLVYVSLNTWKLIDVGVYLSTQVEVTEQDGGLRAGDYQDNEDEEEEAKHVVHLVRPGNTRATTHEAFRRCHDIDKLLWKYKVQKIAF